MSNTHRLSYSTIALAMLSLLCGGALAVVILVLVIRISSSSELMWPSVKLNPSISLFFIAIEVLLLAWLSLASGVFGQRLRARLSLQESTISKANWAVCFSFVITSFIGSISLGIIPDPKVGSLSRQSKLIPVFPPVSSPAVISYVVFFENGSSQFSPTQDAALRSFFVPLSGCKGLELEARGYVSSRAYGDQNEARNLDLSARRIAAVVSAAKSSGVSAKPAPSWKNLLELEEKRGFVDSRKDATIISAREVFNRRVEMHVISYGECAIP